MCSDTLHLHSNTLIMNKNMANIQYAIDSLGLNLDDIAQYLLTKGYSVEKMKEYEKEETIKHDWFKEPWIDNILK